MSSALRRSDSRAGASASIELTLVPKCDRKIVIRHKSVRIQANCFTVSSFGVRILALVDQSNAEVNAKLQCHRGSGVRLRERFVRILRNSPRLG